MDENEQKEAGICPFKKHQIKIGQNNQPLLNMNRQLWSQIFLIWYKNDLD